MPSPHPLPAYWARASYNHGHTQRYRHHRPTITEPAYSSTISTAGRQPMLPWNDSEPGSVSYIWPPERLRRPRHDHVVRAQPHEPAAAGDVSHAAFVAFHLHHHFVNRLLLGGHKRPAQ